MSSTRGSRLDPVVWPGCVSAWLCTSATVEGLARGRACWAAGQIGESTHPPGSTGVRKGSRYGTTKTRFLQVAQPLRARRLFRSRNGGGRRETTGSNGIYRASLAGSVLVAASGSALTGSDPRGPSADCAPAGREEAKSLLG